MVFYILQMFEEKVEPTWDGGYILQMFEEKLNLLEMVVVILQMFVEKVKPTWDGSSNITDVYGES